MTRRGPATTEFWLGCAVLAVALVIGIQGDADTAQAALLTAGGVTSAYALSRGVAKRGERE